MAVSVEQFVLFGTDNVGLERILRLLQALCQVLSSSPAILLFLIHHLASAPSAGSPDTPSTASLVGLTTTLVALRSRLNLSRRFLRLFRFTSSFYSLRAIHLSHPPDVRPLEAHLDFFHRGLMGCYGLLESATLPDMLDVPGLQIFRPAAVADLNLRAQGFWFGALACAVASGLVRLFKSAAYGPVPDSGDVYGMVAGDGEKDEEAERTQRERLKQEREETRRKVAAENRGTVWKLAADSLDLLLPGTATKLFTIDPAFVGVAMIVSTTITGWDVWSNIGKQIAKREDQKSEARRPQRAGASTGGKKER